VAEGFVVSPSEVAKLATEKVRAADRMHTTVQLSVPGMSLPLRALGDLPVMGKIQDSNARAARAIEALVQQLSRKDEIDATRLFSVATEYQKTDDEVSTSFWSSVKDSFGI
jgi:Excreted virulence factor EspC, type VII ESX diderm